MVSDSIIAQCIGYCVLNIRIACENVYFVSVFLATLTLSLTPHRIVELAQEELNLMSEFSECLLAADDEIARLKAEITQLRNENTLYVAAVRDVPVRISTHSIHKHCSQKH